MPSKLPDRLATGRNLTYDDWKVALNIPDNIDMRRLFKALPYIKVCIHKKWKCQAYISGIGSPRPRCTRLADVTYTKGNTARPHTGTTDLCIHHLLSHAVNIHMYDKQRAVAAINKWMRNNVKQSA